MIEHPWLVGGLGVACVLIGVSLLVVLASRRARDRRDRRKRIAARREAYRQGTTPPPWGFRGQWLDQAGAAMIPPPATSVPPLPPPPSGAGTSRRGGVVYGTPTRDPAETSVMPRCPWSGGDRG